MMLLFLISRGQLNANVEETVAIIGIKDLI